MVSFAVPIGKKLAGKTGRTGRIQSVNILETRLHFHAYFQYSEINFDRLTEKHLDWLIVRMKKEEH